MLVGTQEMFVENWMCSDPISLHFRRLFSITFVWDLLEVDYMHSLKFYYSVIQVSDLVCNSP